MLRLAIIKIIIYIDLTCFLLRLAADEYFHTPVQGILARTPANLHLRPHCAPCFRLAWFGAMSWGNAPKSAGVGCAGKDGKARAEKKKRAPDLWTML